jgi:flagellin
VQLANASSGSKKVIDVGFGTTTAAAQPAIVTGTTFSNLDLSSGTKTFTINDGATLKTINLNAASYTALGGAATSTSNASVNATDVVAMINATLSAATASTITASLAGGKITLTNSSATTAITIAGADATSVGLTASVTNAAAAGTVVARTASGTNAGTTQAQGILDTAVGSYTGGGSYSIANLNIANLVGTAGDTDLQAIITAVDKAISKVTDAGTKLGANKTQIDGQKTFVDTLMKANDRTIGILVDADIEEESTKLKALQTQQQLAVQALSIANSSSQNVLSLFR